MKRGRVLAKRTILASIAGLVALMVVPTNSRATAAATPQIFASLHGEGGWAISESLVGWQNELASASSYVDLNYIAHGSSLAKQDLAKNVKESFTANNVDFAISGVPFTADQLQGVAGGVSAFISAPVVVGALATLVEPTKPPNGGSAQFMVTHTLCDGDDPSTWPPGVTDPSQCTTTTPYTGPVRIPNRNLAAIFMRNDPVGETPKPYSWNSPAILRALGLDPDRDGLVDSSPGQTFSVQPDFSGRSDPDEITYYMQQFVKVAAPDIWKFLPKLGGVWEPIQESIPRQPGIQRDGAEEQVNLLDRDGCGAGADATCTGGGAVAPAPPSLFGYFKNAFPGEPLDMAEMQNANGEWVAPTPQSIDAAVDAGGNTPLYALTHKVAGAYPLVWTDNLYAPAHGLSPEKTEGIAILIRYLATTGQEQRASVGEGRLSTAQVLQSLAAADQLVASNCVGRDRAIVESSDPGPLTPPTATTMKSIGTMKHCVRVGPQPTTTTTTTTPDSTATTPTTAFQSTGNTFGSGPDSTGSGQSNTSGTTAPPAVSTNTVVTVPDNGKSTTTTKPRSVLLTASQLPLSSPAGASGTDRLTTFLLGAALYLLLRKPLGRAFSKLTL